MSTSEQTAPPLRAVSGRPHLGDYFSQLWERRFFIVTRAKSLALNQHQGTILGNLWLVVAPMLDGLVYFFIFGILFSGRAQVPNYFAYLVVGMFLFAFTSRCINQGTGCIQGGMGLIRAFSFPRAAIPISLVVREVIALAPTMFAMIILIVLVPPHAFPKWTWLLLPVVILLQAIFNLGLAFIAARIGAILPDIRSLIPFMTRIWMYMSCVMLHISIFDKMGERHPIISTLAHGNPMYVILDSARLLMIDGVVPSLGHWLQLLAWSLGTVTLGFLFFWQKEVRYGRTN